MRPKRVAIYTRKSTDENMSLEFTSLDNQRMRAEAFIKSQPDWECIETRYDDAGYSGRDMNRPAAKRLLADVEAGEIDVVLVYRSDRMSRSQYDLVQLVKFFDEHQVTFASVTESISTATPGGRMALGMLATFAQYERELISERTAHKIAAARELGQWTGGKPLLGYDIERDDRGSRLVVNDDEAAQVAALFDLYLKHESLLEVARIANERGWRTKVWTTKAGRAMPGRSFTKNVVHALLRNPTYIGKIAHKKAIFEGQHDAIVDPDLFERVQFMLQRNALSGGREVRNKYGALLRGLLHCKPCGCAMTHSYTKKRRTMYRYYRCTNSQQRGKDACPTGSLPAAEIERYVVEQVATIGRDDDLTTSVISRVRQETDTQLAALAKERTRLIRSINRQHEELGYGDQSVDRARLLERVTADEERLQQVEHEIKELQQSIPSSDAIDQALRDFTSLWEALTTKEQVRLLNALIQRIDYDGAAGEIAITYHPTSLQALSEACHQHRQGTAA